MCVEDGVLNLIVQQWDYSSKTLKSKQNQSDITVT